MVRISLFLVFAMCASAATDLSGTWKLNLAKSDYGENYRIPTAQTTILKQSATKLTLTQDMQFEDPPSPIHESVEYRTDGRPSVNAVMGNNVSAIARWDGDDLVIESKSNFNGTDIFLRDRWVLSADKKTLTLKRHFEGHGRKADQTIVFDKQ